MFSLKYQILQQNKNKCSNTIFWNKWYWYMYNNFDLSFFLNVKITFRFCLKKSAVHVRSHWRFFLKFLCVQNAETLHYANHVTGKEWYSATIPAVTLHQWNPLVRNIFLHGFNINTYITPIKFILPFMVLEF